MPAFTDQIGHQLSFNKKPERIVSLVPSQTELLFDLGLDTEVVGLTKFCIHPESWVRSKQRVGGTKQLHLEKIRALEPDLIIANKEENLKEQVEVLQKQFPVWTSDIKDLDTAFTMIHEIGKITSRENAATSIIGQIKKNFTQLPLTNEKLRTAYLIWRDPYMTVGADTFIHSMLGAAGFDNIFKNRLRYPEIVLEELHITRCQLLLLSSEPYPFQQKHIDELQQHLPDTRIVLVDGEMFSWYGSRLIRAAEYFNSLRKNIETISFKL